MKRIQKAFFTDITGQPSFGLADQMRIFHVRLQILLVLERFLAHGAHHRRITVLRNVPFNVLAHIPPLANGALDLLLICILMVIDLMVFQRCLRGVNASAQIAHKSLRLLFRFRFDIRQAFVNEFGGHQTLFLFNGRFVTAGHCGRFLRALVPRFGAIIFQMIVQQEFARKLLETEIAGEILDGRMDENVMRFRFGRFEHFVADLTPAETGRNERLVRGWFDGYDMPGA